MGIDAIYELFQQYPAIVTDTRKCLPGSIFLALKGDRFDGNSFVLQALENGCAYAIADGEELPEDSRIIRVANTLRTLQQLANYHRKQFTIPVIGITGTNGKTTTKELMAAVLSSHFHTLYTQGNLNNHIGVPLTLLQLTRQHEVAIIEMGANHPGEIEELAYIAEPTHGLITNVGRAHLEGFGSFDNVVKTKGELYDFLQKHRGIVFVNNGNFQLVQMVINRSGLDTILYQPITEDHPVVSGNIIQGKSVTSATPFLRLKWYDHKKSYSISTHLIGKYNLENVLAAITVGVYFNVPSDKINRSIENYIPQNNRSQLKQTDRNCLVIDAYNANPTSMQVALENFLAWDVSPKALILGDMKELGEGSMEEHQKIIDFIKKNPFDKIMLCGEIFSSLGSPFLCFSDVNALTQYLKSSTLTGYTVLIKGSRSIQLEKAIEFL